MSHRPDAAQGSFYTVEDRRVVAETPELRVVRFTLAPGEVIPWHFHSNVADTFFCLEGTLEVETRAPRACHRLSTGDQCEVPPKTAHVVSNKSDARTRFLIVQGVGAYDFVPLG